MKINQLLGKLKVAAKLRLLIALASVIIISLQITSATKLRNTIIAEREIKATTLVQTLESQIEHIAKTSELSETQRKAQINDLINAARYDNSGYFFLFDTQGNMVVHPIKPHLNGLSMTSHPTHFIAKAFQQFVKTATQQGSGFVHYLWPKPGSYDTERKVSYVKKLDAWSLILGTGIYLTDVEEQYQYALIQLTIETVLYIALLLGLSTLISRNIIKPLHKLTRTMDLIAQNRDLTIQLKSQGNDELAQMAVAFNHMTTDFRTVVNHINDNTCALASSAEELACVTNQIQTGIAQQNSDTEMAKHQIGEIDECAQTMFAQTQLALEKVANTSALTANGLSYLKETVESIEQIGFRVESASIAATHLQKSSNQIEMVLEVINKITEQTNLLALNAAIEAARAGEQGRGFAVVADEVRTLAMRTQQSTLDIKDIISEIQRGVMATVEDMQNCKQATELGKHLGQQTNDALKTIHYAVNEISDLNQQIAKSTAAQSLSISNVVQGMLGIASVAEQTETGAKHTQASSHQLSEMSCELNNVVSQFKVA
ncbi:methyl-accepting chemotaxis sensory transducer [Pseudoalteromonas luteoviolacea B = ATCC 29581]|nr:methyl-accepting chemotaxis sensory transducer [Pseudoalteromonas luteoviolacea B = ATCC 29581]